MDWSYVAGFFDGEGCVLKAMYGTQRHLYFTAVNPKTEFKAAIVFVCPDCGDIIHKENYQKHKWSCRARSKGQ